MKLWEIILQNFRGYYHNTRISIGSLTALIGKNNVGKSLFLNHLMSFLIKQKWICQIKTLVYKEVTK